MKPGQPAAGHGAASPATVWATLLVPSRNFQRFIPPLLARVCCGPGANIGRQGKRLTAVLLAGDLLAWTWGLLLTGALRRATAPRLRYALLHTAGRLVRSARRTTVRIPRTWPWAEALRGAVARCARLPAAAP